MSEEVQLLAGVHPEIAHLSWMVGTWSGVGYNEPFGKEHKKFEELIEFTSDGKTPTIQFRTKSWWLNEDDSRGELFREEHGIWIGGAANAVRLELEASEDHKLWSGTTVVSGIQNAVITGAHTILQAVDISSAILPTAGSRTYGLVNEQLMSVFEFGIEGAKDIDKMWSQLRRV
ncbi:MAG: hypothetical protein RLZZ330_126 [Actinomycetota bacterium]|jgi:hypothetical protein